MGRRVWIQFTGGEPTMHPRIIDLLDAALLRGFSVSLISNGSRTFRFWEKIAGHLSSVILTYHSEFADHAHFLKVGRFLAERMPVHVNVTMLPDQFDEIHACATEIAHEFRGATLSLKPLRVGFRSELFPYSSEQKRRMEAGIAIGGRRDGTTPRGIMEIKREDATTERMAANRFILRGMNQWRGWECQAGLQSLRIKGDGAIYRAVCGSGGQIGLLGGPIDLPDDPVICNRDTCGCVADILISRRQRLET